jgi:sporulation protein YlmC with PRC-barrel domain
MPWHVNCFTFSSRRPSWDGCPVVKTPAGVFFFQDEVHAMMRTSRFAGAALACCLAAAGATFCQAAAPVEREVVVEGRGGHSLRAKTLIGSKVSIEGGTAVGTVTDIIFDNDGTLDYLVVDHDNKFVTVPWEAAKWDLGQRTAVINITPERWQEIPTYTSEAYPNFYEPAYREKIYNYYNVKPRPEIRIERREERRAP